MKNKILFLLIILMPTALFGGTPAKNNVGRQLFKNFNLGWDINYTNDYRWRSFHLGTGYGEPFEFDKRVSWQIGANLDWSKYTLYSDGKYALSDRNDILKTKSITFPFLVSYDISKTFFHGLKVYTGPSYELILSSRLNNNSYSGLNMGQLGWTIGTRIRFLAIFSARLAYNYYPTSLFRDNTLNRSNISFSLGF